MNKLEMAQRFAEILLVSGLKGEWDLNNNEAFIGVASDAWKLADAMQKEADSRNHIGDSNEMASEWQPDWSQAPDDANYWAMDENGLCNWYKNKPEIHINQWDFGNVVESSKSFNYQGSWQDSLRKRP